MHRDDFDQLFESALETAAKNAENKLGITIPRNFQIKFYGPGYPAGNMFDPPRVLDMLFLGDDLFYRIIDVAVIEVSQHVTTVFVRVSGHQPGRFEETWNDPLGSGPFKQLLANQIKSNGDD